MSLSTKVALSAWLSLAGAMVQAIEPASQPAPSSQTSSQPSSQTAPASQPTSQPIPAAPAAPAELRVSLRFVEAPVETVLDYLSNAFGLVIMRDGRIDGRVSVVSRQPVTAPEAVELLNTVLGPLNYVAVSQGRTVRIISRELARKGNVPVGFGADPEKIRATEELLTQVIPLVHVDAVKLRQDLLPLVSQNTDLSANASSNTLVITDTSANIRRIVQIVSVMDSFLSATTDVRVYPLKFASSVAVAKLLNDMFKTDSTSGRTAPTGNASQRTGRVNASGDEKTNTLVISGPKELLVDVERVIKELDIDRSEQTMAETVVLKLQFAQATAVAKMITELYKPTDTPGQGGAGGGRNQNAQPRGLGLSPWSPRVVATGDDATCSLVVSGPKELMPEIQKITKQLDDPQSEQQSIFIFRLRNAQARNLEPVLNNIFGAGSNTSSSSSSSQNRSTNQSSSQSNSSNNRRSGGNSSSMGSSSHTTMMPSSQTVAPLPSSLRTIASALAGQVFVVADADINALLIATSPKLYEQKVKTILQELDRPVPQVLIKVLLAEVSHTDTSDIGVESSFLDVGTKHVQVGTDLGLAAASGGMVVSYLDADIQAKLRLMATRNKLDVLSRPYILTSDNQQASILVGQQVPFVTDTRITDNGQTINTIQYQDIGIMLNVTPHINPDGKVIMDVAPEISALADSTVQISNTVSAPIFNKRNAQCRVSIDNGRTIVIGGLMEDRKGVIEHKVPILGDIPLLSYLFKRTEETKTKTELLIFLTPHVAMEPEVLKAMTKDEMNGTQIVPKAVSPGTFDEHLKGLERGATTLPSS